MAADLSRLVPLQEGGSRPPLYCVHAVSGSPYAYAGLARRLGPEQPVYGFEAPGFDNDRQPIASLPELAAEYAEVLREFSRSRYGTDGDYRLLGWSLGGVVVFEMAKLLAAQGIEVAGVILVDTGRPEVMDLPSELDVLRRFLRDLMGRSDDDPPELEAVLCGQPADAGPAEVFLLVESAGVLPPEIDAEVLADQYAVFRALLQAFYSVHLTGRWSGVATHLLAQASPRHEMDWSPFFPQLTERIVPGTHHSIWTGDNLNSLGGVVRELLTDQVAPCP